MITPKLRWLVRQHQARRQGAEAAGGREGAHGAVLVGDSVHRGAHGLDRVGVGVGVAVGVGVVVGVGVRG